MSTEIISYEGDRVPTRVVGSGTVAAFRRLADGDLQALEELYDLEADALFALGLWITGSREDAADAVQEIFVKLAARRTRLAQVRRPRAYLLAMVRSAALDRLRSDRLGEPAAARPADRVRRRSSGSTPGGRKPGNRRWRFRFTAQLPSSGAASGAPAGSGWRR